MHGWGKKGQCTLVTHTLLILNISLLDIKKACKSEVQKTKSQKKTAPPLVWAKLQQSCSLNEAVCPR